MVDGIEVLTRIVAPSLPALLFILVPGYWLAQYARKRRLYHLRGAVAGAFVFHLLLTVLTPVVAYPDARYVWEFTPGRSTFADAVFAQLALLLVVTAAILYGLRQSDSRVLGVAVVVLGLFTFGIPVVFWYWSVFPLEAVLLLFYAFQRTDHPIVTSNPTIVQAVIWSSGPLLAALAFVSVYRDSLAHVVVLLVLLVGMRAIVVGDGLRASRSVRDVLLGP